MGCKYFPIILALIAFFAIIGLIIMGSVDMKSFKASYAYACFGLAGASFLFGGQGFLIMRV